MTTRETKYEKSEHVLWAPAPDGIVLHNPQRLAFRELQNVKADIWAYLDGAHSPEDILRELSGGPRHCGPSDETRSLIRETIEDLILSGFLVERDK